MSYRTAATVAPTLRPAQRGLVAWLRRVYRRWRRRSLVRQYGTWRERCLRCSTCGVVLPLARYGYTFGHIATCGHKKEGGK